MDPTSAVARTEHLVLFSRLGPSYRPADLERALWVDRTLFEYRAYILPVDDLPIHQATMRSYPPRSKYTRHEWVRRFLAGERGVPAAHPAAPPRRGAAADARRREPHEARVADRRVERRRRQRRDDARDDVGARRHHDRGPSGRRPDVGPRRTPPAHRRDDAGRATRPRGGGPGAGRGRCGEAGTTGLALRRPPGRRVAARRRPPGPRRDGDRDLDRRREGRVDRARPLARGAVPRPHRGVVAVRPARPRPIPARGALGVRVPPRDLRAEGEAPLGLLRAAGAPRRPAGGPVRPAVRTRHA